MDYSFGNSSSSSSMMDAQASSSNVSLAAEKEQIMERVRSELAANNAQELISKLNEKCFAKCIGKPGSRLDGSEQTCIAKCMDRYMDSWNVVSKALHARIQREAFQ